MAEDFLKFTELPTAPEEDTGLVVPAQRPLTRSARAEYPNGWKPGALEKTAAWLAIGMAQAAHEIASVPEDYTLAADPINPGSDIGDDLLQSSLYHLDGAPDWYQTHVLHPWKTVVDRVEDESKAESFAGEVAERLIKTMGGMAVTLPADIALGGAILKTVDLARFGSKAYEASKVLKYLSKTKPFVAGMIARNAMKSAGSQDPWRFASDVTHAMIAGAVMQAIPEPVDEAGSLIWTRAGKNALGWTAFNVGSLGWEQGKEILRAGQEGRPTNWIPRKEWLLAGVEGIGISAIFTAHAAMKTEALKAGENAANLYELAQIGVLLREGRYNPDLVTAIIKNPEVPDNVRAAARELESTFIDEAHLSNEAATITTGTATDSPDVDLTPERVEVDQLIREVQGRMEAATPSGPDRRVERKGEGDRRKDAQLREAVDSLIQEKLTTGEELTAAEALRAVEIDPLTGSPNRYALKRVLNSGEAKPITVVADMEGLKALNDSIGHEGGDELVKSYAKLFQTAGVEHYRLGGDEMVLMFDNEAQAREVMPKLQKAFSKLPIKIEGKYYDGANFSYGLGKDFETADKKLQISVEEERTRGLRGERGKLPNKWRERPDLIKSPNPEANRAQHSNWDDTQLKNDFEKFMKEAETTPEEQMDDPWVPPRAAKLPLRTRVQARDLDAKLNWGTIVEINTNPLNREQLYRLAFYDPFTGKITKPNHWYRAEDVRIKKSDLRRYTPADVRVLETEIDPETRKPSFRVEEYDPKTGEYRPIDRWLTQKELDGLLKGYENSGFLNEPDKRLFSPDQRRRVIERLYKFETGEAPINAETLSALHPEAESMSTQEFVEYLKDITTAVPEMMSNRRSQTWAETTARAKNIKGGTHLAFFKDTWLGLRDSAVKVTASRMTLEFAAGRLFALRAKALAEGADSASKKLFVESAEVVTQMAYYVKEMGTELGRGLNSLKMQALPEDLLRARTLEDLSKVAATFGKKSPFIAAWGELFRGWMFSNPATHGVNMTMNWGMVAARAVEGYTEVGLGFIRGKKERKTLAEVNASTIAKIQSHSKALHYITTMFTKAKEAYDAEFATSQDRTKATRVFEDTLNLVNLVPYSNKYGGDTKAFTHDSMFGELDPNSSTMDNYLAKVTNWIGMTSRASLSALGVEDVMFRYINHMGKIHEISVREAHRQHLTEMDYDTFVRGFVRAHTLLLEQNAKPPTKGEMEEMEKYVGTGEFHREAAKEAAEAIFANDIEPGDPLKDLMSQMQRTVGQIPALIFMFPTFKTPFNIISVIGQRTPGLHLLSQEMRQDMRSTDPRRRDAALAKLTFGTMLYIVGGMLYAGGHFYPNVGRDMRDVELAANLKPDSFIVNGLSVPVSRYSPFGNFLTIGARFGYLLHNTVGAGEQGINLFDMDPIQNPEIESVMKSAGFGTGGARWSVSQAAAHMMVAFSSMFGDQIFLGQLKSVMDAVWGDRGTKGAERLFQRTVTGATIPMAGLWRAVNSSRDPVMREVEDTMDAWKAATNPQGLEAYRGVPGLDWLADPVRPRYTLDGYPVKNNPPAMGMFYYSDLTPQPYIKEALKLQIPLRSGEDDTYLGVDLTKEQQERWHQIIREMGLREYLNNEVLPDPEYLDAASTPGSIGMGTKGQILTNTVSSFRRAALGQLNEEYNDTIVEEVGRRRENVPSEVVPTKGGWGELVENITARGKGSSTPPTPPSFGPEWDKIIKRKKGQ
jgi:diguanylate cyclase (GGDEF)-like protein